MVKEGEQRQLDVPPSLSPFSVFEALAPFTTPAAFAFAVALLLLGHTSLAPLFAFAPFSLAVCLFLLRSTAHSRKGAGRAMA
jgi:hypothetical protein